MGAFDETGAAGSAVDPLWDAVFGAPLGDQEAAFEGAAFEPVPRCAYLFKFESAEGRIVGGYPTIHFGVRISKGPAGTANRGIFDDLFLAAIPRQGETPAAAVERLRTLLTRFRNHLKLVQERPLGNGKDVEALSAWGRQFIGHEVAGVLRVEGARKEVDKVTGQPTGREFDARNRIIWASISDPAAPYAGEEKKYIGMTYGQRVDAEIAEFDRKAAGGGRPGAKTAGGAFGGGPSSFFGGGGSGA